MFSCDIPGISSDTPSMIRSEDLLGILQEFFYRDSFIEFFKDSEIHFDILFKNSFRNFSSDCFISSTRDSSINSIGNFTRNISTEILAGINF